METTLSEEKIKNEFLDETVTYFLISESEVFGYAKTVKIDPPKEVTGKPSLNLERLYLRADHQSRGAGAKALEYIVAFAKELEFKSIWISVFEGNSRALDFYQRKGFQQVGKAKWTFVSRGRQYADDDIILELMI